MNLHPAGAVIPMAKYVEGNNPQNPKDLEIWLYKGNNSYTMYEDAPCGKKLYTDFVMNDENGIQKLTVTARGDDRVMPLNRGLSLVFKNIQNGNVKVFANGKPVNFTADDKHCITVEKIIELTKASKCNANTKRIVLEALIYRS